MNFILFIYYLIFLALMEVKHLLSWFFLAASNLKDSNLQAQQNLIALFNKLRSYKTFQEAFLNIEVYFSIILVFYGLLTTFAGLRYKKTVIFPFVVSIITCFLYPLRFKVNTALNSIINIFYSKGDNNIINFLKSSPDLSVIILGNIISIVLVYIISYLIYLPIIFLVYEIYKIAAMKMVIPDQRSYLFLFAGFLILCWIFKKILSFLQDLVLGLLFSAAGSMLLLNISCIITKYPAGFLKFNMLIYDIKSICDLKSNLNLYIWIISIAIGFRCQMLSRYSTKN
jgi:hypothetical protein